MRADAGDVMTILERIRELQSYAREATATSDIEQIGDVLEELINVVEKLILASGTSKTIT